MLKIREAVIVEGRYDKIKLSSIVDAPIIETNGFRVFSDKEKQSLIRKIAETRGILIMTDSDGAGFLIRNFLKGSVDNSKIKNSRRIRNFNNLKVLKLDGSLVDEPNFSDIIDNNIEFSYKEKFYLEGGS